MNLTFFINIAYIIAAVLFALGLKLLGSPQSARRGNLVSAIGMLIAVAATLTAQGLRYEWIVLGVIIGSLIGAFAAYKVTMTAMPEMVALFNGSGGAASLLVGWAAYHAAPSASFLTVISIVLSVFIGGVTFTGSLTAWGKLSGRINSKPILYPGQKIINSLLFASAVIFAVIYCANPAAQYPAFFIILALSLVLGTLLVLPIGGADMPVVISLLNSYSGLAACAAGFVIQNNILIVAGALVGASGLILTQIMCKAMNRSLSNVLFSGFGKNVTAQKNDAQGEIQPISVKDTYYLLEAARSVVIIPGYGMAVAQAQHAVRELAQILEDNGADVKFAIHPVAGRMPGHMNVLLAEANISYDQLYEMDDINPAMETVDAALVIGANDVVNPAARDDASSPVYGMPVIHADHAKNVIVMKRSMAAGFAGITNRLFYQKNTRMLFGDAKTTLQGIIAEFKD